ncbi:hypothetical protein BPOR_0213g00140 [Botrytis porri]|uniref:Uncharacterized protein n=1 Tax=Botrytis porri TaxID=87229 RepID=A0A4Z1KNF7_9HELO|nr:hypothetical protein BPOR_0213g00140 [Botrytis porri]
MTLDTILNNKMRARYISMLWKCCRCEAAPEALPLYLCNALGAENKSISGNWRYPILTCGDTSCAICYRPKTKCSNSKCEHEKCYGCPSHNGDINSDNSRNSRVSLTIIGGERFALTFLMGSNCRWQCTESSFPNFNVLEGPEPSFWDDDYKDPEPTGQKITRIIPLPRVIANRYLRREERHIKDETNSQFELKDKSMADPQPPMSGCSPILPDRAIQASEINSRPAKTSHESLPQALEMTDIGNNVNNSLDSLEDSSTRISGSDETQTRSDFTITESSGQTTRPDQSKCSEVQGSASISVPTAVVETESSISDEHSPQNPIVRTEDRSEKETSLKDGATPVEEKESYCMSGIAGQAVDLPRPLSTANPTDFVSGGKKFSSYSGSANFRSIRPASPLIRAPTRTPKLLRRMHLKHPAHNPPLTPPPNSPIPPPIPPPEHQQGRIFNPILSERPTRPHRISQDSPSGRWTPLFQESSPQSGTPNLSTSAVIPQKRPPSPAIRPAKIIRRQRRL